MSKKKIFIGLFALVILLAAAGFVFFLNRSNSGDNTAEAENEVGSEEQIKSIKAEDIGLTFTTRSDKKAVIMKVAKLSGISTIEYEASYTAEGPEGELIRGVNGSIKVKSETGQEQKEILLGTCSRNVCKYDGGVKDLQVNLRVNYKNGEIGSLEEKVEL